MNKVLGWPVRFINQVIEESKKVIWPTRDLVIRHTTAVVITVTVFILIFAGVDYLLQMALMYALQR